MAYADPWSAVVADLTAPATVAPPGSPGSPAPARPAPMVVRGRPFSARAETIQRIKERSAGKLRLYAVAFEDEDGSGRWWLCGAEEREDGWVVRGGAGGSGDGPHRGKPWVNLAAWWSGDRFCAGGQVLEADSVRSVRLSTRDTVVLEDDTAGGVVLFLVHRPIELPVVLELRDASGEAIATQMDLGVGYKGGDPAASDH